MLQQRFLTSGAMLAADSDTDSDGVTEEDIRVVVSATLSLTYSVLSSSRFCFRSRVYRKRDVHSSVP